MRKNPRRILSPQRLPFRHPGLGTTNLTNTETSCNTIVWLAYLHLMSDRRLSGTRYAMIPE